MGHFVANVHFHLYLLCLKKKKEETPKKQNKNTSRNCDSLMWISNLLSVHMEWTKI